VANTTIQLKFSTVASNTPSGLANGEIAINSADGKLYYRTPGGSITYLNATYPAGLTTEVQFNDAGTMGSNSGFTFSKTNQLLTVTGSANIGGMNVVPTINSAFSRANSANILAQAAFDAANAAGGTLSQAAFDKANSANVLAQAAFDKANTGGGGGGTTSNTSIAENIFTANGSQTSFTLTSAATQNTVLVFVSGVLQPNSYYTIVGSNTTITLADAPAVNDTVIVKTFSGAGSGSSGGGASVSVSDAAPTSPTANSLWWQSNTGILKIYYTDVDSSQWVDASPPNSSDTLSPFLLMGA
jgi:hypothetical protein